VTDGVLLLLKPLPPAEYCSPPVSRAVIAAVISAKSSGLDLSFDDTAFLNERKWVCNSPSNGILPFPSISNWPPEDSDIVFVIVSIIMVYCDVDMSVRIKVTNRN